ncbi:MAG: type II secretion system major pseudopilin GspG [Verrucomicrobiota bacterium]|jgi:general secretion pathway protein G
MKIEIQNFRRGERCKPLTNKTNKILGARGTRPSGSVLRRAFTLVEMLLVITIIGILAALVVPKMVGRSEQARQAAAHADISSIKTALDAFEVDNGYYPKRLQDLLQQPSNAKNWHGPYLENVPQDPWGNPYVYTYPGRHNPNGYDLSSVGPDGKAGTDDDIGNWTK